MFKKIMSFLLALAVFTTSLVGCQTMEGDTQAPTNTSSESASDSSQEASGGNSENAETLESPGEMDNVWEEDLLDPENPVTVTFYSYSYASPAIGKSFEKIQDNFNNGIGKEKGIVLEVVADTDGKSSTDAKAGLQVDMVQQTFNRLGIAINDLGIVAFEDVIPQEEMDEHFEGIPENALQLGVVDNKMYGLAFTFSTPMLYMNGTIMEEAGLDPNTPPKDFQELYDMSMQVVENTDKEGLILSETNTMGWLTSSILKSNGSDVISEDGSEVVYADDAGVEAFEIWKKFYEDGAAMGGDDKSTIQAWQAGSSAFYIQSTSIYSSTKQIFEENGWKLDGYPMPGFDGPESVPTNSGSAIVIRPDSEQKAQAIWEVIKYISGDEGYTIITSEMGYLPLRPYLAEDENYLKDYVEENPMIKRNIERLPYIEASPIWTGPQAAELNQAFLDMSVKALTTDADVRETMEEYTDYMNSMMVN